MSRTLDNCPVVLQTGFRIFFLGAAIYAVVSMAFWKMFYVMGQNVFVSMPLTVWHGHEMLFGFTMAVVAGFLLTAVQNWTGLPTLNGTPLLLLFLIWCAARIFAFMPSTFPLWPVVLCNLTFVAFLLFAVMRPIIAVKQWKQSAVFSKIILIFISGIAFYIGLAQSNLIVERKALKFFVYMIISLIFTIGRRIMPFFIERGVGYPVSLRNSRPLDIASLILLIIFSILDIFWPQRHIISFLCLSLAIVHMVRLYGWHIKGIWQKPLLWILFIGYVFLIFGFLFKFLATIAHKPDDAAIHAWTAGGIGIFTLGMMARVSWGHTGRNIAEPPRMVTWMFVAIIVSAFFRVFFPIVLEPHYILWIAVSQIFWMIAFGLYLVSYAPILIAPRPDGKWG